MVTARPIAAVEPVSTTGAQTGSTPARSRAESVVELGHHISPHHRARRLAVPLPADRRLESQGGGLGWRRAGSPGHCSGSGEQGLPARADQQRPPGAAGSPR